MSEQDFKTSGLPPPLPRPLLPPRIVGTGENAPSGDEVLGLPLGRRDTAALLALAFLADVCLYRAWGGTGGAVLLVAALAALLILKGRPAAARQLRAGAAILALAAALVWSAWWLAVLVAAVSTFSLAVRLWRPEWTLVESLPASAASIIHAPLRLVGHVVACRAALRTAERKPFPAKVIVIPVAVSVLFLFVFAAANPVLSHEFADLRGRITGALMKLNIHLEAGRLLFWCGWLLVFAALIRPVIRSAMVAQLTGLDVRLAPCEEGGQDSGNFLVARATLICVNVVFLGYNGLDAVYLYFKATLPAGITWTAYTHAGCGWLTFGLFLSTVVLGVIFWRELNFHARAGVLKRLAFLWIAQNALLAGGTLRRIWMYTDYSGLTQLLLTGVYGSVLVMAGLAIMARKVHGNQNAIWLLRRYAAAFAIGVTVLVLTPHGLVCAGYNVPRIQAEKPHAMWPVVLKELPPDALPPIVALLDYRRRDGDAAREKLVREGIAAILGQHLVRLEQEESRPWSQWQASSWWALRHLRAVRGRIYETVPPERWGEARRRLKSDYDLSGAP